MMYGSVELWHVYRRTSVAARFVQTSSMAMRHQSVEHASTSVPRFTYGCAFARVGAQRLDGGGEACAHGLVRFFDARKGIWFRVANVVIAVY